MPLSQHQQTVLAEVVRAIGRIGGVSAIALGGSFARNRARANSDLDVALYYRDSTPFSIAALRAAAAKLHDLSDPVVSKLGEWGPWVNGGAWLTVRQQRVDVLYRSLDRIEAVIRDAQAGRYELHYAQQPPYGFFSPTYLGEVCIAIPQQDPGRELGRLQDVVAVYPDALRRAVVQNCLWGVEFGLTAFAPKFADSADGYGVAGCLARFAYYLVLVLFALNRTYLLNDKTALTEVAEFEQAPAEFAPRVRRLLGNVGESTQALKYSLTRMRELFDETAALTGELYRSQRMPG